eukprot:195982_1
MSEDTLKECLNLFERLHFPKIYPNPKFANIFQQQAERNQMTQAGLRFRSNTCSLVANCCLSGDYQQFLSVISHLHIPNLNQYFEAESRLPLMHFVMFGRKQLLAHGMLDSTAHNHLFAHLQIAQWLLDHGLYVDIQSKWGYSALFESVINEPDLKLAEFLLQNGADPNIKNVFGSAPLHTAVMGSNIGSIKLLCKYGANPTMKEEYSEITPLYLARTHQEATAILYNAKRKMESGENKLECEDISYCAVCDVSSKIKPLFKCRRCQGPIRYCGQECQKQDWSSHKGHCVVDKMKINERNDQAHQFVFVVQSAQGHVMPNLHTQQHEAATRLFGNTGLDRSQKTSHKKRGRKYKKEMKKLKKRKVKNQAKKKEKFVCKIQASIGNPLLVYDKNRKYMVYIHKEQNKDYTKLFGIIQQKGITKTGGCKAYFYCWVDQRHKLHVLVDQVLALQPW